MVTTMLVATYGAALFAKSTTARKWETETWETRDTFFKMLLHV